MRGEDYKLVFDHEVTPTRRHFHVIGPPVMPEEGHFVKKPVKTGFQLPNGQELPFWRVMFANLEIEAERTKGKTVATEAGDEENKE